MFNLEKLPAVLSALSVAACITAGSIGSLDQALADTKHHPSRHAARATPRAAKCLCGYGLSGYEAITCVPVADCAWEHAICRGRC
jgi:hypothetical protein